MTSYRHYASLFIISVILLFFEILFITIFTQQIPLIAYCKYLPLTAAFFGMGLGCIFPRRYEILQKYFVISLVLAVCIPVLGEGIWRNWLGFGESTRKEYAIYEREDFGILSGKWIPAFAGMTRGDAENLMEASIPAGYAQVCQRTPRAVPADEARLVREKRIRLSRTMTTNLTIIDFLTSLGALLVVFVILSLFFYLLGQHLGRYFALCKNPLIGYTINIAGSLCGILLFNIVSFFSASPVPWFVAGILLLLAFYHRNYEIAVFVASLFALIMAQSGDGLPIFARNNWAASDYNPEFPLYHPNMNGIWIFIPFLVFLVISAFMVKKWFRNDGMPPGRIAMNWHLFFMGSAFMVVQTGGISNLSIHSGSCTMANSLIIGLIFLFMFAANFYVLHGNKRGYHVPYIGLFLCLVAEWLVCKWLVVSGVWLVVMCMAVIASAPAFFSSLIFARAIRNVQQPEIALGSNLLGCVLGSGIEPVSMYMGSAALPLVAMGLYGVSYVFLSPKNMPCTIGE